MVKKPKKVMPDKHEMVKQRYNALNLKRLTVHRLSLFKWEIIKNKRNEMEKNLQNLKAD